MQNKKRRASPQREFTCHVSRGEPKLRKPPAMRANPHTSLSLSLSLSCRSAAVRFVPFFFSQPASPPVSTSADIHVFRARLRFRLLDAEERLIVAPFLSVAFTAWGNSPRRESGRAAGRIGKKEGQSIFR